MELEDRSLTERIIHCAFMVHKKLGTGFLEKLYENAMMIELANTGLQASQQFPIKVRYDSLIIGEYYADIFVDNRVICELKAQNTITRQNELQLVNYLKATGVNTGLLINFSDSVTIKRKFRNNNQNEPKNPVNPDQSC